MLLFSIYWEQGVFTRAVCTNRYRPSITIVLSPKSMIRIAADGSAPVVACFAISSVGLTPYTCRSMVLRPGPTNLSVSSHRTPGKPGICALQGARRPKHSLESCLPYSACSASVPSMGHRQLTTLTGVARYGYWVKVACACVHVARLEPLALLKRAMERHMSARLSDLHKLLKCGRCGGKAFTVQHCLAPEAWSSSPDS